ncbi:hypothetical protein BDQ17DRAFT_1100349 [Cyathus striatus]|nr:hypothetical protein BDQ17DRAFT_1100349 [Cyathus striatus]
MLYILLSSYSTSKETKEDAQHFQECLSSGIRRAHQSRVAACSSVKARQHQKQGSPEGQYSFGAGIGGGLCRRWLSNCRTEEEEEEDGDERMMIRGPRASTIRPRIGPVTYNPTAMECKLGSWARGRGHTVSCDCDDVELRVGDMQLVNHSFLSRLIFLLRLGHVFPILQTIPTERDRMLKRLCTMGRIADVALDQSRRLGRRGVDVTLGNGEGRDIWYYMFERR